MAKYLLDTGPLILHLRGRKKAVRLMRGLGKSGRMAISVITRLEVRAGMHPDEKYATQKLLSRFVTYAVNRDIADKAGDYIREYRARGFTLSVPDAVIAATAVLHKLTLVTLNPKHFPMPELRLYPWPEEYS